MHRRAWWKGSAESSRRDGAEENDLPFSDAILLLRPTARVLEAFEPLSLRGRHVLLICVRLGIRLSSPL